MPSAIVASLLVLTVPIVGGIWVLTLAWNIRSRFERLILGCALILFCAYALTGIGLATELVGRLQDSKLTSGAAASLVEFRVWLLFLGGFAGLLLGGTGVTFVANSIDPPVAQSAQATEVRALQDSVRDVVGALGSLRKGVVVALVVSVLSTLISAALFTAWLFGK